MSLGREVPVDSHFIASLIRRLTLNHCPQAPEPSPPPLLLQTLHLIIFAETEALRQTLQKPAQTSSLSRHILLEAWTAERKETCLSGNASLPGPASLLPSPQRTGYSNFFFQLLYCCPCLISSHKKGHTQPCPQISQQDGNDKSLTL